MASDQNSPRNYIAFISYRHKPLDMAVAKKLHQRIERYVIPADLRKDGQKKLGLVFRDQEELPISSDLNENIRMALDHSQFLIVVCTPDTPESLWVQREITYFVEKNGRNRVLAILADGEPDVSFPKPLTEVRNEAGELTELIEPLAANIVADTERKRNQLFRTESLRILASLIGCPYDALYRREQRYKMRRLAAAAGAAALVAAGFIGMLLNRNAMIREQLLRAQKNESETLAALSETALRDGNYRGALEYALNALPGRDPGRPYMAVAEKALSSALYLYQQGMSIRYDQSFAQDTEIRALGLSPDGKKVMTGDEYGTVNLYDRESGALLWSVQHGDQPRHFDFVGDDMVLVRSISFNHACYSLQDGSVIWSNSDLLFEAVSEEHALCVCDKSEDNGIHLMTLDAMTGRTILDLGKLDRAFGIIDAADISSDGRWAAVLARKMSEDTADLFVFDLQSGERQVIAEELFDMGIMNDYQLRFGGDNVLAVGLSGDESILKDKEGWEGACLRLYDPAQEWACRFEKELDFGNSMRRKNGLIDTSDYLDFIECGTDAVAVASKTRIIMINTADGSVRWQKDLPEYVLNGIMYENDTLLLMLGNGLITFCNSTDGLLGYDLYYGYFDCDYELYAATGRGDRFMTSGYVVVPENSRNIAAAISPCGDNDREPFPYAEEIPAKARLYFSPSGKTMAAISADETYDHYTITRFDPSGAAAPASMTVEAIRSSYFVQENTFVTESGRIIAGSRILDPGTGEETGLSATGEISADQFNPQDVSCTDPIELSVHSACIDDSSNGANCRLLLWKDGEPDGEAQVPIHTSDIPEEVPGITPSYYCGCRGIGANGYTVVSAGSSRTRGPWIYAAYNAKEDCWKKMPQLDPQTQEIFALAQKKPWLALQKADGTLLLVDLDAQAEFTEENGGSQEEAASEEAVSKEVNAEQGLVLTVDNPLPGASVVKMLFTNDDQWLIVLSKTGEMAIFDTADGHLLHRSGYANQNLRYYTSGRYDALYLPERERLLVIYDTTTYRESACVVIDTVSFEQTGFFTGVCGYLPELDRVVVMPYQEKVCFCPLYSTEELERKGEDILQKP